MFGGQQAQPNHLRRTGLTWNRRLSLWQAYGLTSSGFT